MQIYNPTFYRLLNSRTSFYINESIQRVFDMIPIFYQSINLETIKQKFVVYVQLFKDDRWQILTNTHIHIYLFYHTYLLMYKLS